MPPPLHPRPSRLPGFLLLAAGTALFIALAADVTHHGTLAQADHAIAPYLYEHANYWLIILASAFSGLGEFWLLFPLALLVGTWLLRRRLWRPLAVWAAGLLGSTLICGTLKSSFAIPRPVRYNFYAWDKHVGYTFPSGHTMGAMITAGLLALLWMHLRPRPRRQRLAAAAAVGLLGSLVAASLLYVGVHYLTDVLAGIAVSLAWLGVLRLALPPAQPPSTTPAAPAAPAAYDQASQTPPSGGTLNEVHRPADSRTL